VRADPHRPLGCAVDDGRGHPAVVHQSQGAPTQPAARGHRHSIREAPVGLDQHQQALVPTRHLQPERLAGAEANAHTEHLARAQARMERRELVKATPQFGDGSAVRPAGAAAWGWRILEAGTRPNGGIHERGISIGVPPMLRAA
jgi:hypothetical protein